MVGAANIAADGKWEFERIEGELDAAIVFAAAAGHEYQNGNLDSGATCLSDAVDIYEQVLGALPKVNLTGAQLQNLKAKLIRLRHELNGLRTPVKNEVA